MNSLLGCKGLRLILRMLSTYLLKIGHIVAERSKLVHTLGRFVSSALDCVL